MTKKRILIVEDEAIIAFNEKELLEKSGYEVIGIVDSAEEAIRVVDADCPDLILMDITLKGEMDGIQAIWKILENHKIPIIIVTANGDKVAHDNALHGKLSHYIIKPYTDDGLRNTVDSALKGELQTPGMT